jgi:nucleotide-binding universal stress UspA family protein
MAGATHARRTPRGAALGAVPVTRRFLLARPVRTAAGVVGIGLALMLMLVMGPSGSGKTTLLLMLGALLRPTAGSITVAGHDGTDVDVAAAPEKELPTLRASTFGFIFQDYALLDALTAAENIAVAANLAGTTGPAAHNRALELLDRVGLTHRASARPSQMSGGEQQRVAVARALANAPPGRRIPAARCNGDRPGVPDAGRTDRPAHHLAGRAVVVLLRSVPPRVPRPAGTVRRGAQRRVTGGCTAVGAKVPWTRDRRPCRGRSCAGQSRGSRSRTAQGTRGAEMRGSRSYIMSTTRQSSPVVVAVDGSERSAGAVRYAIHEARVRGCAVRLTHIAPTTLPEGGLWPSTARDIEDLRSSGERILDRAVAEARAGASDVRFESVLGRGQRVTELAAVAEAGALLVLGRETRRGMERLVTGTTTAAVVARAAVPVVVVPADWRESDHGRIVVGIKSAARDGELLAHAYSMASARHAALRFVHAVEAPVPASETVVAGSYTGEAVSAGQRTLEAAARDWRDAFPDVDVESVVVVGRPADVLVEASTDADVLMLARPHRDLRRPVRLGTTPRAVIEVSDTPVEVVPLKREPSTAPLVLESSGEILKN